MQRWHALRKPAHEEHDLATRIVSPSPEGVGKHVEDFAALPTAIIHYGSSVAHMWRLSSGHSMTCRTLHPFRVQYADQKLVTGLLI